MMTTIQSEDNGNTSLHPPPPHSIALIPLIVLITHDHNFITKVNVLVKLALHPAVRVFARTGSAELLPVAIPKMT